MQIISYGEDAYTLWALTNRLKDILACVGDQTSDKECKIIYRPSFGRAGGKNSSQFGEFDFILLSSSSIYLGESKWYHSSEFRGESLNLRKEQIIRHQLFTSYLNKYFEKDFISWEDFTSYVGGIITFPLGSRMVAPLGSRLANNLLTLLQFIKSHFNNEHPIIVNMLLYLYHSKDYSKTPTVIDENFELVNIDYSKGLCDIGDFIELKKCM